MARVLAEEVVEPPGQWPARRHGAWEQSPGCRPRWCAGSAENLKAIMKPSESQSSFHRHRALVVLNNVSDPLLPIMGQLLPLLKERPFYLVWCFGWAGLL